MKITMPHPASRAVLLALCLPLLAMPSAGSAAENPYDLLSRTLQPMLDPFTASPRFGNRALTIKLRLAEVEGGGSASLASGATLSIDLQVPDKARLRGSLGGAEAIVWRDGDRVRAWPAEVVRPLLEQLPDATGTRNLPALILPLTNQQIVFAPALFRVADKGGTEFRGESCRLLQLALIPEISDALGVGQWIVQASILTPEAVPARIQAIGPGWKGDIHVDALQLHPSLPDATWKPTDETAANAIDVPPAKLAALVEMLVGMR